MSKIIKVRVEQLTGWKRALNAARLTANKAPLDKEPIDKWKRQMLLAEHSPIRQVMYDIHIENIPMFATVHLARHHIGVEKFVCTQREDRNEKVKDRSELSQTEPNSMMMTLNAQAIINISRQRLCTQSSKETRKAWKMVIDELRKIDPILAEKCVPNCLYRNFCPEMNSCGYGNTERFKKDLENYRKV